MNDSVSWKTKEDTKLEKEKDTQAMEAEVDEDDGTFTNISLADDTGKALRDCSAAGFKVSPLFEVLLIICSWGDVKH